jgi:membrane protein
MGQILPRRTHLLPALPFRELAGRIWNRITTDNVFGRAAELAYFFLFSLFPLLIVLTTLLALLGSGPQIEGELLRYFRTALPRSAYQLIVETLREINESSAGGKLSFGILLTVASASSGMVAVIEGLNTAYGVKERRRWIARRMLAIGLTLALAVCTISALAIFLYGTHLGQYIAARTGLKTIFETAWPLLQWPVVVAFVVLALTLTYHFAPNLRVQSWRRMLPGAAVAFLLWLAASLMLRLYLRFFDTYSTVYGSLGGLIVLMIWFYLFGVAILVGGEVNSVLENAAAQQGEPDAKRSGERAPSPK